MDDAFEFDEKPMKIIKYFELASSVCLCVDDSSEELTNETNTTHELLLCYCVLCILPVVC